MTVEQIRGFLDQSIKRNHSWRRIRLSGGEPTVHPDFLEIVDMLIEYKNQHSPKTELEVNTNGSGKRVKAIVEQLPSVIKINDTMKEGLDTPMTPYYFRAFNMAPSDDPKYADRVEYSNACRTPEYCGIGLNGSGFFPCVVAAGIDRVMGWEMGREEIPDNDDDMLEELRKFCKVCGHFKREPCDQLTEATQSPVWEQGYENWRQHLVPLTLKNGQSQPNSSADS